VLAPDVIGAAFIDPTARRVVEAWRDGKFVAVMNRELIALHLRVFNRMALAPELIKRWAYWLSSPGKTIFVDKQFTAPATALCEELANAAKADAIICWKYPFAGNRSRWLVAQDFL
jgi:hypothetical protein